MRFEKQNKIVLTLQHFLQKAMKLLYVQHRVHGCRDATQIKSLFLSTNVFANIWALQLVKIEFTLMRRSFVPDRRRRSRGPKQWRAASAERAVFHSGSRRHCSGTTNTRYITHKQELHTKRTRLHTKHTYLHTNVPIQKTHTLPLFTALLQFFLNGGIYSEK